MPVRAICCACVSVPRLAPRHLNAPCPAWARIPCRYTDLPLIQPLLACTTLNDCRSFVCKLRDAGDLAALAANSRALRASPQPSDRPLHAGSSGAGAGGARPAKRARKPGGGGGPGSPAPLRRGSAADGAPLAAPAGVDDTIEVGKHGRLHDKPYVSAARRRATFCSRPC